MCQRETYCTPLASRELLDPVKTFECGQCFRWNGDENGVYTGVVGSKTLRVWTADGMVMCSAPPEELPFWQSYFDLDTDYTPALELYSHSDYLTDCARFGAGIRILRQDPWETLCSFIISQCNNIPRIKSIVEKLCCLFGDRLESGLFSFPGPERIAPLSPADLAPLRCGYRAEYILDAARQVTEGLLDLEHLYLLPSQEIFARATAVKGVGKKVADCFMLYGLHIMDRFPVDVWMKRALKENLPADFDPSVLGNYSGLTQQYIFYYARSAGQRSEAQNC